MSRVKLMSAMAFDIATFEETRVSDPVIVVPGELPASPRPFGINLVYKAAQGVYEEVLAIAGPDGTVLWESDPRHIELRGQMFEDLFRRRVTDRVEIASTAEHTLLVLIDGQLVARVPVFIDAPESATGGGVLLDAAEVALKKGSICWLTIPQRGGAALTRPAWYVQQGRSLFVLRGDGEQELPGLDTASTVTLTVKSKEIKAALGTIEADVRAVTDDAEFTRIATLGLGTRLNLPDGEAALERWARTCELYELSPRG
jgi:hypothetical protein